MWEASVGKSRKRINMHVVHRTVPAPLKATGLVGQTGQAKSWPNLRSPAAAASVALLQCLPARTQLGS